MLHRLAALAVLTAFGAIDAHDGHGQESGLVEGIAHPLMGIDHLVAMIAVGLLAAAAGGSRRFALPATFLASFLIGGSLLHLGGVPGVEWAVAASIVPLGIALALRPGSPICFGLVALAGVLHGHVHFGEGSGAAYVTGIFLGSVILHAIGLGIGMAGSQPSFQRWTGASVGTAGLVLTVLALI